MPVAAVLFGDAEDRDSAGEGWWRSSCSCLCCCCCLLIGIQRQEQQPPPGRNQKEELGTSVEQLSSGVLRACLVCLITSTIEPRTQPRAQFSNIFYRNCREERRNGKKKKQTNEGPEIPHHTTFLCDNKYCPPTTTTTSSTTTTFANAVFFLEPFLQQWS